jgi:hypothetical protein
MPVALEDVIVGAVAEAVREPETPEISARGLPLLKG